MTYMLDADICIAGIRFNPQVLNRIQNIDPQEIWLSSITVCELEFGALKGGRPEGKLGTEAFIKKFQVFDLSYAVAKDYASIRLHLESKGLSIGKTDTFLAAHARYLGLTLVTNNLREFQRVPGLKVETWL